MTEQTPMFRQYRSIKEQYPDEFLFFRMGDFYEMFFDDAVRAAEILEIALTARSGGSDLKVPMCGVPCHGAAPYIRKLTEGGHRVAICEQVEDPASSRGIVRREVVRVVTPGTVLEEGALAGGEHNYLVALWHEEGEWALASCDLGTGEFAVCAAGRITYRDDLLDEMARLCPSEVLLDQTAGSEEVRALLCQAGYRPVQRRFSRKTRYWERIRAANREGVIGESRAAELAAAFLLYYLEDTQKTAAEGLRPLVYYRLDDGLQMDRQTRRNLEISRSLRRGDTHTSLLGILDETRTPMGARALRDWLERPLVSRAAIQGRQDRVEALRADPRLSQGVRDLLRGVYDMERIAARIAYERAGARDLKSLGKSLQVAREIRGLLETAGGALAGDAARWDILPEVSTTLEEMLADEPPATLREGGLLRDGADDRVDELRDLADQGENHLAALEEREREETGIRSLKVGCNRVFGYYIEVTRSHLDRVPERYVRKQTLAGAERYVTAELKDLENRILTARDSVAQREYELFCGLREGLRAEVGRIQKLSGALAGLDVLASFAATAAGHGYVRPRIDDTRGLEIVEGRHPVVERLLRGDPFVPNGCVLEGGGESLAIITGPNMAGKSTYIRMVAVLVLMAQAGSFVPCESMRLGVVDRVFARVGASDDLAHGESTFLVEMNEASHILRHATDRSLVVLDEVGRGTSTIDGLSIAWAISEYLQAVIGARSLFATHYHELVTLADRYEGIKNLSMAVQEHEDTVVFLRRVVPGGTDRSYGIHVAQMAGLPEPVIRRAREKLEELRQAEEGMVNREGTQLSIQPEHPALSWLRNLDPNDMNPRQALEYLYRLRDACRKE